MDRKAPQDFAKPQYPYGVIEGALAGVFDLRTAKQRAKLRAHIKHAQRLGLGSAAGKGARYRYSLGEACQLLFVMLAGEIDVFPAISVPTIKKAWPRLQRWFEQAIDHKARSGNPIWLSLRPQPMSGWASGGIEWLGVFRWKEEERSMQPYNLLDKANDDEWLCTRNLSAVMFKFLAALKSEETSSGGT